MRHLVPCAVCAALFVVQAQSTITIDSTEAPVGSAAETAYPGSSGAGAIPLSEQSGAIIREPASTADAARSPERGELLESRPALNRAIQADLTAAKNLAKMGTALYFVGLGVNYGIAVPMTFAAALNGSEGLGLAAAGIGLIGSGFQISGSIRSGIGASLAYDAAIMEGLGLSRNVNWGFYKAGWVFIVINSAVGVFVQLTGDIDVANAFSFVSLGLGLAADAMWITSTVNSLAYTRRALNEAGLARLEIAPFLTYRGGMGARATYRF